MSGGVLVSILLLTYAPIDTGAGDRDGPGSSEGESVESERDVLSCGTLALYILCRLEGRPVELTTLAASLPEGSPVGHSLARIRDAAAGCGLNLLGVRLGRRDWPLDRPALVHLDRHPSGHFVVIRPVGHTGKLVQVIDARHRVEVMDIDRLTASREWTGLALVPGRPNWVGGAGVGLLFGASGLLLIGAFGRLRHRRKAAGPHPMV